MSTLQFNTANTEGIDFNETWTVYDQTAASSSTNTPDNPGPRVAVGTTVKGTGDSDFVCVSASSAIAAGDVVQISTAFAAASITTATATFGSLVGVAVVAIASGAYGWVQRAGRNTGGIWTAVSCAPNVSLATTTTAGVIDDITTTGKTINGIIITATNNAGSNGVVAGMLNYPVVGATL